MESPTTRYRSNSLRESGGAIFHLGAKTGSYVWVNGLSLPSSSRGVLYFEAKAYNDIHISLNKDTSRAVGQDGRGEDAPIYEFVVGGWMNSKTAIRKRGIQQAYVAKRANLEAVISPIGEFCKYWVKIEEGLLSIGKGGDHAKNEVLRWQDDEPPGEVRYIGFSSWDTPIQFRNMQVEALPYTPYRSQNKNMNFLVHNSSLSDRTFVVEQQKISAHSSVLCCCSDYFWKAFVEEPISHNEMALEDVKSSEFMELLQWCYGGRLLVQESNANVLNRLGETFGIKALCKQINHLYFPAKGRTVQIQHRPLFDRLFLSTQLSDITFVVESVRFPCHKAILSLASQHFFSMFTLGFKEATLQEIEIHDVSTVDFRALIHYIYCGHLSSSSESVEASLSLLMLADRFDVPSLMNACYDYLSSHLQVSNCCDILSATQSFNAVNLHDTCMRFLENNFQSVADTEEFLKLDASLIMELLCSNNLMVSREEQIFENVMKWGEVSQERLEELKQLLTQIRYPIMEQRYVEEVIIPNKLFEDPVLAKKIKKALHYMCKNVDEQKQNAVDSAVHILSDHFNDIDAVIDYSTCPRRGHRAKELLFANCGDTNGVFYWIGTNGKTTRWSNPHKTGQIRVNCSSPISRYTKLETIVGRTFVTTSFAGGNPAWWAVDLGDNHTLICNHYTLHMDGSPAFFRSWNFQGSNDAFNWVDLKVHVNDETITHPGQAAHWAVYGKNASSAFRYFRVILTGPTVNSSNTFALCGLELYGYFN